MTTSEAKTSQENAVFDVSKYMITNQVQEREIKLANTAFKVKIKDLSWSKKNQLIAKAMAFGGQTEGMSFDADYYVKECLKANAEDKLSNTYLERVDYLKKSKPKDWDGIWVMTSK